MTTAKDSIPDRIAEVRFELRNGIAFITFDHVAARNAMTVGMYQGLKSICEDLSKNSTARVVILRGAGGKSFVRVVISRSSLTLLLAMTEFCTKRVSMLT
ncbi:MAG: hypothetical protein RJA46_1069 [Pseudomonadota bacterium]